MAKRELELSELAWGGCGANQSRRAQAIAAAGEQLVYAGQGDRLKVVCEPARVRQVAEHAIRRGRAGKDGFRPA
jgi:hypothetical protein